MPKLLSPDRCIETRALIDFLARCIEADDIKKAHTLRIWQRSLIGRCLHYFRHRNGLDTSIPDNITSLEYLSNFLTRLTPADLRLARWCVKNNFPKKAPRRLSWRLCKLRKKIPDLFVAPRLPKPLTHMRTMGTSGDLEQWMFYHSNEIVGKIA